MKAMDYVKEHLERLGIPVTRDSYVRMNWPGVDPKEPLDGELEAELPEELQGKA